MKDEEAKDFLATNKPEPTWDEMIAHKKEKYGGKMDEIYQRIIETASTANAEVNKLYGVNRDDKV